MEYETNGKKIFDTKRRYGKTTVGATYISA
jgi:hypothetical protein